MSIFLDRLRKELSRDSVRGCPSVNEIAAVVRSGQERIAHGVYVNSALTAVVLLKLAGFPVLCAFLLASQSRSPNSSFLSSNPLGYDDCPDQHLDTDPLLLCNTIEFGVDFLAECLQVLGGGHSRSLLFGRNRALLSHTISVSFSEG